jgi:hypothetical protein
MASLAEAGTSPTSAFTYQGQLRRNGVPYTGSADLRFTAFKTVSGGQAGGPIEIADAEVVNGLFTVEVTLDEGVLEEGTALELEVAVRVPHDPTDTAPFTTLSPRQPVTAAPFAGYALLAERVISLALPLGAATDPSEVSSPALNIQHRNPDVEGTAIAGISQGTGSTSAGVSGRARGETGMVTGVRGSVDSSPDGIGVLGEAFSPGGATRGVWGRVSSPDGHAGYFDGAGYFSGNLGIGTPAPQARLHVLGEVRSDQIGFSTRNPNNAAAIARFDWDSDVPRLRFGGSGVGSQNGFDIQGRSNVSRLRILDNGNVGIGSTAPAGALHILRGSGSGVTFTLPNDLLIIEGGAVANILLALPDVPASASLRFARPSNFTAAEVAYFSNGDLLNIRSSADISLSTGPSSVGTRHLTLKNDGKIGIGTVTPRARLHVLNGAASGVVPDSSDALFIEAGPSVSAAIGLPEVGSGFFAFETPSNPRAAFLNFSAATDNLDIGSMGAVTLSTDPGTGHETRMTVANDGRVGIGTAAPEATLHVLSGSAGEVTANDDATLVLEDDGAAYLSMLTPDASESGILFGSPTSQVKGAIIVNNAAMPNGLQFRTNGNQNRMVIDADGKVGIGTTTPANPLSVGGDVDFSGNVGIRTTSPAADLHIRGASTLGSLLITPGASDSNSQITLAENASGSFAMMMRYDGAANELNFAAVNSGVEQAPVLSINRSSTPGIGVGTTSPAAPLHVFEGSAGPVTAHGSASLALERAGHNYLNILAPNDNETGVLFGNPGSGAAAGGVIFNSTGFANSMQFRTGTNDTQMIIKADGDVAIGTFDTGPGRLNVAGSGPSVANFNRIGDDGIVLLFQNDGVSVGSINVSGGTVSYNAFTGSHYAWAVAPIASGALVSMTGENRRYGGRENAEVVYGIAETTKPNDPACLGVYIGKVETGSAAGLENPLLVAATGNGEMCVVDRGEGDIAPGDYLISSDVAGCAMKDDPARFPVGHIVARAAERMAWPTVPRDDQGVRKTRISVLFGNFVRTGSFEAVKQQLQIEKVRADKDAEIWELKRRLARLEVALAPSLEGERP